MSGDAISPASPAQFESLRDGLRVWAPAKLNLDLRVYPRRADGMHGLDSIVVKITLCDRIDLRPRQDGEVRLTCTGADCGPVEKNLAFRAAAAVRSVPARASVVTPRALDAREGPPCGETTNGAVRSVPARASVVTPSALGERKTALRRDYERSGLRTLGTTNARDYERS